MSNWSRENLPCARGDLLLVLLGSVTPVSACKHDLNFKDSGIVEGISDTTGTLRSLYFQWPSVIQPSRAKRFSVSQWAVIAIV